MQYSGNTLPPKVKLLFGLEASGGGALKHIGYLAKYIDKEIFEVTIILSPLRIESKGVIQVLEANGVKVLLVEMRRNISLLADIKSLCLIVMLLRKEKYDIVHAHSSKAGALLRLAAWMCQVPLIFYTPHCFFFQGKVGLKKRFFLILEKLFAKLTKGIILSENEKEQALQNNVIDPSRLYNINNAIDLKDYNQVTNRKEYRSKLGIPIDSIVIAGIGRLEKQKGWEKFIEIALEMLDLNPDTFFIIAGDGPLREQLPNKIPGIYTTHFKFIGFIKEISEMHYASDAILSTSLYEGLPYVYIEAIKFNKKLVTTCFIKDLEECRNRQYFPIEENNNKVIAIEINRIIQLQKYSGDGFEKFEERFLNVPLFIKKHETLYINCYEYQKQKYFNYM